MRGVVYVRVWANGERGVVGERNFFFPFLCASRGRKRPMVPFKTPLFWLFFNSG